MTTVRTIVHLGAFALGMAAVMSVSGAPPRVHAVEVVCLAFGLAGILVLVRDPSGFRRRLPHLSALFLADLMIFDRLSALAIAKREFLNGWEMVYPAGLFGMLSGAGLIFLVCHHAEKRSARRLGCQVRV